MVEAWYTYTVQLVYHSLHRKEAIFMSKNASGLGSLTYTIRNGKKYWTGRITIGQGATVGGNIWVTEDVPAGARIVQTKAKK